MREDGPTNRLARSLSLSLANTCNPYCKRIRPGRKITRAAVLPLVFHLAPTHLGWDTQRQFLLVGPGTPRGRNADNILTKSLDQSTFAHLRGKLGVCFPF
jgi:hypothetical protein